MGGGSANAAAALQGLNTYLRLGFNDDELDEMGLALGADVPMCLSGCRLGGAGLRVRGIGENLEPAEIPNRKIVLVNPRVPVSTPDVFRALRNKDNFAIPDDWVKRPWPEVLHELRNDLEAPAISLAPEITNCLKTLKQTQNCLLARMSGSGATCFGLYDTTEDADAAAQLIQKNHPDWWVVSTRTMS